MCVYTPATISPANCGPFGHHFSDGLTSLSLQFQALLDISCGQMASLTRAFHSRGSARYLMPKGPAVQAGNVLDLLLPTPAWVIPCVGANVPTYIVFGSLIITRVNKSIRLHIGFFKRSKCSRKFWSVTLHNSVQKSAVPGCPVQCDIADSGVPGAKWRKVYQTLRI